MRPDCGRSEVGAGLRQLRGDAAGAGAGAGAEGLHGCEGGGRAPTEHERRRADLGAGGVVDDGRQRGPGGDRAARGVEPGRGAERRAGRREAAEDPQLPAVGREHLARDRSSKLPWLYPRLERRRARHDGADVIGGRGRGGRGRPARRTRGGGRRRVAGRRPRAPRREDDRQRRHQEDPEAQHDDSTLADLGLPLALAAAHAARLGSAHGRSGVRCRAIDTTTHASATMPCSRRPPVGLDVDGHCTAPRP